CPSLRLPCLCSHYPHDLHSFPTRRSSDLALVDEGGTKPLVQFTFVKTSTDRQKYAGRIEWSEEFEMDNEMLFSEIITMFEDQVRSEEHTSELQSRENLVCRLLLEKKKKQK